ncbi:hypothetical protein [Brucella intermedia]|uniref:hypothetical protein n=1 Tax=Brucella intermedia TaxID=94625 RepID=UPI002361F824|nr:hypothetical protein [Brucella intermedia]
MAEQRKYSPNYNWALPLPQGNQIVEIKQIGDTISDIDASFKTFVDAYNAHKHKFRDIEELPTTLEGYGITDAMTSEQVGSAISESGNTLSQSFAQALSSLSETITKALGLRVRVDEVQEFSLAQKKRARDNIEAVGVVDKGAAGGVAPLGADGKVASTYLPALTTTATVGAAMAGANGKAAPDDGDFFGGVLAGGSTMFKTTWANIKAALATFFDGRYLKLIGGTLTGLLTVERTTSQGAIFRNTGAGDSWINFYAKDAAGWYSEFGQRSNGAAYIWTNGHEFRFQTNGQFWSATDIVARGVVYGGSGSSRLDPNGNVVGSLWSNWGSVDAYTAIDNRIYAVSNERASAWAVQEANRKVRKAVAWDQWNFTFHDQRMQNQTGENLQYTAEVSGSSSGVYLQISPDNNTYWTVGKPLYTKTDGYSAQYTAGCLPPGWWMRIIRTAGSYNANVILIW